MPLLVRTFDHDFGHAFPFPSIFLRLSVRTSILSPLASLFAFLSPFLYLRFRNFFLLTDRMVWSVDAPRAIKMLRIIISGYRDWDFVHA